MLLFLHFLIIVMLCTWVQVSLLSLHTRLLTNTRKTGLLQLMAKLIWKCKLIFPTDTLQQKIEITDLKPFLKY